MQGVQIRSLVGELRSHMPRGQKNKNIKQKQYCSKFNKDFKKVHIKKIFKKKREGILEKQQKVCCVVLNSPR